MRPTPVALGALAAGLVVATVTDGMVRGAAGDVLIVVFLVALAAALGWRTPAARLAGVGALALGLELVQLLEVVGPEAPRVVHLVLGSTFDPWDLAAYAAGLAIAAALERHWKPALAPFPVRDHNPAGRPPGETHQS